MMQLRSREMRTADFNFDLPPDLIAQQPAARRDQSRLLVLHRNENRIEHRQFRAVISYFRPGDVLVLNNSRVIRARLRGTNTKSGGAFEILLLEENAPNDWWAMMKPGKRARVGTEIQIGHRPSAIGHLKATVTATNHEGHRRLQFSGTDNILADLDELGEIPLPPYIRREPGTPASHAERPSPDRLESRNAALQQADAEIGAPSDDDRYQTVFAEPPGSVAAPTAGLHFTTELLQELRARGVEIHFVTLHVGLGTFAPVKADALESHVMHEERYEVSEAVARAVNEAKLSNRRVIAVGTTSVRVLESAVHAAGTSLSSPKGGEGRGEEAHLFSHKPKTPTQQPGNRERLIHTIRPGPGRTRIFIHPPYEFKIVDALLTNFHLPCSTLLMLVSAFASPGRMDGRQTILHAYAEAIRERYRFFSYGDAMLIV